MRQKLKINNKDIHEKINTLKEILKKLKSNDPDPVIRIFCSLCLDEPIFFRIANDVFNKRPSIEEEHFIFLVFVSLQYLTKFSYDNIDSENNKIMLKRKIREDLKKHLTEIQSLCANRYVSTNIPERYVGLQIVSSMIYQNFRRPLTVVDIGCSLGLGLMALNTTFFERKITIQGELLKYARSEPTFNGIIGLDIQKPELEWILASYLPETREKRKSLKRVYNNLISNKPKIKIIQGNALTIKEVPQLSSDFADIVWISNTCYQVEGDIKDVIKGIGWLLKEQGLWLYAYYRYDIEREIVPEINPYVVSAYVKDKNWEKRINKGLQEFKKNGLELLEAPHESVQSIKPSQDYEKFINLLSQNRIL